MELTSRTTAAGSPGRPGRWRPAGVLILALALAALGAAGCATIPGKTGEEQAENIDALVKRTLEDLYKQELGTKEAIEQSVGYAVMSNTLTKIPLVGAGSGYGVAIDNRTGARTYLKMSRLDLGAGWGVRSIRPVVIFTDEAVFKDMIDGEWEAQAGAEAAAKAGEGGAAGGAAGAPGKQGYSMHVITDAGVSATATVAIIHLSPVKLKD
jgi:lipid-binding SYLF domain-containing protein